MKQSLFHLHPQINCALPLLDIHIYMHVCLYSCISTQTGNICKITCTLLSPAAGELLLFTTAGKCGIKLYLPPPLPPMQLFNSHVARCDSFCQFNLVSIWRISNTRRITLTQYQICMLWMVGPSPPLLSLSFSSRLKPH